MENLEKDIQISALELKLSEKDKEIQSRDIKIKSMNDEL